MKGLVTRWMCGLLMLLPLQACSMTYRAEPIEAWVVDAETNQALEGVIVVAHWQLMGGLEGGNDVGQLMIMETVTDKTGRFTFPAWGPKWALNGRIKADRPAFLMFKSGYLPRRLTNAVLSDYGNGTLKSDWNGKTINMEKFKGNLNEYAKHLDFFHLRFAEEDCNWKNIPQMILAIDEQYRLFRKNGIETALLSIYGLDGMSPSDRQRCGSALDFFERRKK